MSDRQRLKITSPCFADNGPIPDRNTGFGEDLSPAFRLHGLCEGAVSIAIMMDDLDIPCIPRYSHWLIWNLPVMQEVPEGIPHGRALPGLGGAAQGIGYGKNGYRGPKPPAFLRKPHRYVFSFFVLDCRLELESRAKSKQLLRAMQGHILQQGEITGTCRSGQRESR